MLYYNSVDQLSSALGLKNLNPPPINSHLNSPIRAHTKNIDDILDLTNFVRLGLMRCCLLQPTGGVDFIHRCLDLGVWSKICNKSVDNGVSVVLHNILQLFQDSMGDVVLWFKSLVEFHTGNGGPNDIKHVCLDLTEKTIRNFSVGTDKIIITSMNLISPTKSHLVGLVKRYHASYADSVTTRYWTATPTWMKTLSFVFVSHSTSSCCTRRESLPTTDCSGQIIQLGPSLMSLLNCPEIIKDVKGGDQK